MKQKFSTSWNSSVQPRKQRKFVHNAPSHIKRKLMSATLSKELRAKHGRRSLEVRKGDEVKIMRGKFSGKQGKVDVVNMNKLKIGIEGITITKTGGEKVAVLTHPSNVKIIAINSDDKRRMKSKVKTEVKPSGEKKVEAKKETKTENKQIKPKTNGVKNAH